GMPRRRVARRAELPRLPDRGELDEARAVVAAYAEVDGVTAGVEVLQRVERLDQAFAVELRSGAPHAFDQDLGGDVGLERSERVVLLAEELLDRRLVFLYDGDRRLGVGRHDLRHDHAGALFLQLARERAGADERGARELRPRTASLR